MKPLLAILLGFLLCSGITSAQTISVFDTLYTPPGYPQGDQLARMYMPAIGNGIGVVVLHGLGGSRFDYRPWCEAFAAQGYLVMALDYPDIAAPPYPGTYPNRPRAVKTAVEFLRRNASSFGLTTGKIVGWGGSQGAVMWGEAITWDNDDSYFQTDSTVNDRLDAAILVYGHYDYEHFNAFNSAWIWGYFSNDSARYLKGSCIKHVENISTPVLLIHGTADSVLYYQQSQMLHDSLIAHGKQSQLLTFVGLPHGFDVDGWSTLPQAFTPAGIIARDTALTFLRRIVAPALKIRPSSVSVDFSNVLVSTSDTATVRIDNIGSSTLHLMSIGTGGTQYTALDLPSFPAAILPGGSMPIRASFHPDLQGVLMDTLTITSDDSLHPIVRIALRGKGLNAIQPAQPGVVYTISPGQPEGTLYTLNVSTGALTPLGSLGLSDLWGLTVRPSNNELIGLSALPAGTGLYRITADIGAAVRTSTVPLFDLRAIAFSAGDTLYGATATGKLYRIDPSSGDTTLVGNSPGLTYSGLSFSPTSGRLWASARTPIDSIYTMNLQTGISTFVGTTGFNAITDALAFDPAGILYALINSGSGEMYLSTLDTVNASGTLVFPTPLALPNLRSIAMRTDSTGVVAVEENPGGGVPAAFTLGQNYPNPFNPATTITFAIPNQGGAVGTLHATSLQVFDLLGRRVATLVDDARQPGVYSVTFDASNLSTGTYLCRLRAGGVTATRRMMLVK